MIDCIWPVAATLGEGPVWDAQARRLWFVDIKGGRLHVLTPETGARDSFEIGGNPSFALPADGGGLVIGNRDRLLHWRQDGVTELARIPGMRETDRTNDATVDGAGRLWFGTMDDLEETATGRVRVFDGASIHEGGGAAIVTNGPAISGDGSTLYHVDSLARTIWRFDIRGGATTLFGGVPFRTFSGDEGLPDGVVVDAQDHLWVGFWAGGCARRFAPDGTLVTEVRLPCANVTKLAFGGPDLRTAYVTTARAGLSAAELAAQPLAGGLFSFRVEVPGRVLPAVRVG